MGHTSPVTIRFNCVLLCILLSGCVSLVKISYPLEAVIHPTFDQPYTIWRRERVQVEWTPSLHGESFKYLASHDQVLLANSIRQTGSTTSTKQRARVPQSLFSRRIRKIHQRTNIIR